MAVGIPSASPAVNFREIDLTGSGPGNDTTAAVFAGSFNWGPVYTPVLVANEARLVDRFGAPDTDNNVDFISAAQYLGYSDELYIIRGLEDSDDATSAVNAFSYSNTSASTPLIKNTDHYDQQSASLASFTGDSDGDAVRGHELIARYPGSIGNSLEVQICPGDSDGTVFTNWTYASEFDAAPGTSDYASARDGEWDEVHVVVVDKLGLFTGTKGTVLEKYPFVSVATNARTADGSNNYIRKIINDRSEYIHFASFGSDLAFDSDAWGLSNAGSALTPGTSKTFTDGLAVKTFTFASGADAGALTATSYALAFDTIEDTEKYNNIDLLIAPGMTSQSLQTTVVNDMVSIAQGIRKDCVVIASPNRASVVNNSSTSIVSDTVACANSFTASSYLFVDNNYLKAYDKYNDEYVWIPAASSTAGIMAATDFIAAPWFSPGGTRRGNYRNIVDIYHNPTKAERDTLYKASVNPIANFRGDGILLFGDKTKLGRPSAFDRINVRRLFLTIEKYISRYSRNILFEFNDEFTRAEFVGVVEPYLRSVQARRGITDFRVVCDETNNTPEVIDNNEFIATMFVKPARSINFITLNFVAVRTGVAFEEVAGAV
jgi:hypothetical protein